MKENENEKREAVADIVAEMRREVGDGEDTYCGKRIIRRMDDVRVRQYCDRIGAAAKREKAQSGNAAAMREALVKCREIALQWQADEAAGVAGTTDKPSARSAAEAVIDMEFEINAALSEPARQCDVGTAEEQAERYNAFCGKHFTPDKLGGNCRKCPLRNRKGWSCQLAWAQMPYDAEEGGAK